ncbi:MAG: hypothetical protein JWP29_4458 [Rhodoferax sp.]|nr:hypothetical protein [Rhodoferax sp.]
MSTHYESLQQAEPYRDVFHVEPPEALGLRDLWPRKPGYFIRALPVSAPAPEAVPVVEVQDEAAAAAETGAAVAPVPPAPVARELVAAQWGLMPHWVKSASDGKLRAPKLVNARSETVSSSHAFRDAWLQGQRCIVPMAAFFEDDWRNGKALPTRISRIDGQPMGAAGLWAQWTGPDGEVVLSYTLLTVNANNHALLRRYQPAGSEKRMPVVLGEGAFDAWLSVRIEKAREFMRQYPANWLAANPVETKADKVPQR